MEISEEIDAYQRRPHLERCRPMLLAEEASEMHLVPVRGASKLSGSEGKLAGMTTSGIEDAAMRLLEAFYDLSGHNPTQLVALGTPESPPTDSAANAAGMDLGSTELDVALRYLLDQHYVKQADAGGTYTITVMGIDKVREMREA